MKIKVGTVCTGIGAPEQAIKNLGIDHEIVFSCDIDKYARQTYEANFKSNLMFHDMTSDEFHLNAPYSDLFIGGIPCQSFSLAGKRLGELDKRGLLFYDYYEYVKSKQPKAFIIENVKGLLSDNKGKTFQNWLLLLGRSVNQHEQMFTHPDSLEYNLHYTVLNSKNFGVPQNRERVFIVGIRKDLSNNFSFPKGWKLEKRLKDVLEPDVDEKYYLSQKMVDGFISKGDSGFINQDTQASKVHGLESVAPTLSAGTHGYANGYIQHPVFLNGKDISNTIRTGGRGSMTDKHSWDMIIEPATLKFERTEKAKNDRKKTGSNSFQDKQIKIDNSGIAQTVLTSVAKDNLIIEPFIKQRSHGFNKGSDHEISPIITGKSWKDNNFVVEPNIIIEGNLSNSQESNGRVYNSDGIAPTVTEKQGGGHEPKTIQYNRIRRLTPLECFRLQGFPDEYVKPCSDTQSYKQAGNSITVYKAQAVIKNLLHIIA